MLNPKFLSKREYFKILEKIKQQYGIKELSLDYVFLINKEKKLYLVSKDICKIDISKLRVNSIGLYFCKLEKDGPRLTIEGSQLVGKLVTKNIIELNQNQLIKWLRGENISVTGNVEGFVIIKNKNDFYGTGKLKENTLINYLPKERRLKVINQ